MAGPSASRRPGDPMTYEVNGKQYVVISAGGHGSFGTKMGDYIVAYALPDESK